MLMVIGLCLLGLGVVDYSNGQVRLREFQNCVSRLKRDALYDVNHAVLMSDGENPMDRFEIAKLKSILSALHQYGLQAYVVLTDDPNTPLGEQAATLIEISNSSSSSSLALVVRYDEHGWQYDCAVGETALEAVMYDEHPWTEGLIDTFRWVQEGYDLDPWDGVLYGFEGLLSLFEYQEAAVMDVYVMEERIKLGIFSMSVGIIMLPLGYYHARLDSSGMFPKTDEMIKMREMSVEVIAEQKKQAEALQVLADRYHLSTDLSERPLFVMERKHPAHGLLTWEGQE